MKIVNNPDEFKFIKPGEVRTRFAPSPTGSLHIGSVRTALFNYLFAKKYQGNFILRIEDTDVERSKPRFEKDIIDDLKWLGIEWTEGPASARSGRATAGKPEYTGAHGPYRQSERGDIYAKYLEKLLKEDKAYYCFCTEEELEAKRQEQMSRGLPPRYNGKCAKLFPKEIKKNLEEKKEYIIRFKTPSKKIEFNDMVRGKVEFDAGLIGDITIAKDLSSPLYNFAVVVDDFEMKISHVIRGEDLLPNTPKQILLQKALGFPRPQYAHLPLILGSDKSKLSKRHEVVSINEYKKAGYFPEALINFLAFLGWNPGTEREIYSLKSLIKDFSIEKVQKSGATFNIKRLEFLNGFYIRQKSAEKLTESCLPYLIETGLVTPVFEEKERVPDLTGYFGREIVQEYKINSTGEKINPDYLKKIVFIYQERLKKLSEVPELTDFFFKDKLQYDKGLLKWQEMAVSDIKISLDRLEKILSKIKESDWNAKNLEKILIPEAEKIATELKKPGDRGYLLWPLRVALTGKKSSAGPFEVAEILGKDKVLKRIGEATELVGSG